MNAVLPGNVETEGIDELGPEYRASMEASIPLGRLGYRRRSARRRSSSRPTRPRYITGQTIVVDGGQIAARVAGGAAGRPVGERVTEPVPGLPAAFAPLRPRRRRCATACAAEIAEGAPPPGERLGAERELAARLGVSRSTLRAALDALETAGACAASAAAPAASSSRTGGSSAT